MSTINPFRGARLDVLDHLVAKLGTHRGSVLGLSGPQGAGKSTVAARAAEAMGEGLLVLGLDDFYLPQAMRFELAKRVSPLFQTRGPPGTHDIPLLRQTLAALFRTPFEPFRAPLFDKAADDRCPLDAWREVVKSPEMVILEGWCIGATLAPDFLQSSPINSIERRDGDLAWRTYQAEQLAGPYQSLWDRMCSFVHLEPPGFEAVLGWRTQQEASNLGLARSELPGDRRAFVADFIQHYERITRDMAKGWRRPGLVLRLDEDRKVRSIRTAT